jgi:UDP-glucose 4-epimerase
MTKSLEGKDIILTGASGEIGSIVSKKLIFDHNPNLTILTRDINRSKIFKNISKKIEIIHCDLSSKKSMEKSIPKNREWDVAIHLAATMQVHSNFITDMRNHLESDIIGTINLVKNVNIKNSIIFSSSVSVYGNPKFLPVTEEHPLNPEDGYSISKLAIENLLGIYSKYNDITFTALRISSVYGPSTNKNKAIPIFIDHIMNEIPIHVNSIIKRDYIYIDDVANSIIQAIIQNKSGIFNISTNIGTSLIELIKIIEKISKKRAVIRQNYIYNKNDLDKIYSYEKARNAFNFKPSICLENGINKIIKNYKMGEIK